MKKLKESTTFDNAIGLGNPVLSAVSAVVRGKIRDQDNQAYRDEQQKQRDAERAKKQGENGAVSVAPEIPAPKTRNNNSAVMMPKSIRPDENLEASKVEVPSEFLRRPDQSQGKVSQKTGGDDDLTFGQAFAKNRKSGAKIFTWKGNKYTTKLRTEDANVVGGGNVAGLGVGGDGEPGIPKKRRPRIVDLITFMKRK